MKNPDSLLAKVLKGKYCRQGDVLQAKAKSSAS